MVGWAANRMNECLVPMQSYNLWSNVPLEHFSGAEEA